MKQANDRIRVAIQKSGRLSDECFKLLKNCGIKVRHHKSQLFAHCENFPLDLLLVRDDDIPGLVQDNVCDCGIVGQNVLQEFLIANSDSVLPEVLNLKFGACRLSIAVPEEFNFQSIDDLANKRIATSYPQILQQYLTTNSIEAQIIELSGSVEIAPGLDIADAICDLVSSGATLEANNLIEVQTILASEAVLINNQRTMNTAKQTVFDSLIKRIFGVQQASESKYIMLHAPKNVLPDIVSMLPGAENPTIMQLEHDKQKVAVHVVCRESIFWDTLEQLKALGASSILVMPIEKMMA